MDENSRNGQSSERTAVSEARLKLKVYLHRFIHLVTWLLNLSKNKKGKTIGFVLQEQVRIARLQGGCFLNIVFNTRTYNFLFFVAGK